MHKMHALSEFIINMNMIISHKLQKQNVFFHFFPISSDPLFYFRNEDFSNHGKNLPTLVLTLLQMLLLTGRNNYIINNNNNEHNKHSFQHDPVCLHAPIILIKRKSKYSVPDFGIGFLTILYPYQSTRLSIIMIHSIKISNVTMNGVMNEYSNSPPPPPTR